MNQTKKTILALTLIAAASASYAQTSSTGAAPVGLLGQRYGEIGFTLSDIRHVSSNGYTADASINAPVTSFADVNVGYSYDWFKNAGLSAHDNVLDAGTHLYTTIAGVKPFVGADVGIQWTNALGQRDHEEVWDASAGVEIPVGTYTVTPRIVHHDDFEAKKSSTQDWTYEVEGNTWITPRLAAFASVGYTDVRASNLDSWNWRAGVRVKF